MTHDTAARQQCIQHSQKPSHLSRASTMYLHLYIFTVETDDTECESFSQMLNAGSPFQEFLWNQYNCNCSKWISIFIVVLESSTVFPSIVLSILNVIQQIYISFVPNSHKSFTLENHFNRTRIDSSEQAYQSLFTFPWIKIGINCLQWQYINILVSVICFLVGFCLWSIFIFLERSLSVFPIILRHYFSGKIYSEFWTLDWITFHINTNKKTNSVP